MTGPFLVRLAFAEDGTPAGHTASSHYPADVAAPQLSVLDLGATRGDGIFETISLGNGHLQALEPHLARFAHSAAMLDLPTPDAAQWRAAIVEVAGHLVDASGAPVDEGFVKIVMTRGVEGGSGSLIPGATPCGKVNVKSYIADRPVWLVTVRCNCRDKCHSSASTGTPCAKNAW